MKRECFRSIWYKVSKMGTNRHALYDHHNVALTNTKFRIRVDKASMLIEIKIMMQDRAERTLWVDLNVQHFV